MTNKIRWRIDSDSGSRNVQPHDVSKIRESYIPQKEERFGYTRTLSGSITLVGTDFDWIYELEKSTFRCDTITLTAQKKCAGVWSDYISARLNLNAANWDVDQCKVELDLSTTDEYECLEKDGDKEFNVFDLVPTRHEVSTISPDIDIEQESCDIGVDCPVTGTGWTFVRRFYEYDEFGVMTGRDFYARYNNGGVYSSPILYGYYNTAYSETSGVYGYKILGASGTDTIDNAMDLSDVLQAIVTEICPSLTVVSDFFQINPENPSADNYVTGEATKTANIKLIQKSDAKRPDVLNNATIGKLTFNELAKFLFVTYQVKYYVSGSTLRFEHVSFMSDVNGLDLTTSRYSLYTQHTRKYTYAREKLPRFERFKLMEASNTDFVGLPIEYTNSCVVQAGTGSEKLYDSNKFTTDLQFVLDNGESNSTLVSDEGFVAVACDAADGIIVEPGILGDSCLNNSMAFAQLHRDYWVYKRPQKTGLMNGVETLFASTIRTKKQVRINVPYCCGDVFNPANLQKSVFGWGEVDRAEVNLMTEMLEIDLLHDAEGQYLIPCPVLTLGRFTTVIGYSFEVAEAATEYVVKIYKDGVLVDSNTHTPSGDTITGEFTGLTPYTNYQIQVVVKNEAEEYERTCGLIDTSTKDLTCPLVSFTKKTTSIKVQLSSVDTAADSVTVKLFKDSVEQSSHTFTTVTSSLEHTFTGLTHSTLYVVQVTLAKGSYTKTCDSYNVSTETLYTYRLRMSAGGSPNCVAAFADYYSSDPTFGVGTPLFVDTDLLDTANLYNWAVDEDNNVWTISYTTGIILTNTFERCS